MEVNIRGYYLADELVQAIAERDGYAKFEENLSNTRPLEFICSALWSRPTVSAKGSKGNYYCTSWGPIRVESGVSQYGAVPPTSDSELEDRSHTRDTRSPESTRDPSKAPRGGGSSGPPCPHSAPPTALPCIDC